ncbi:hypothetical protein [Geitlerinema sp. PCC 9228]|jgi:peptidoglycan hydrolase CwlO-like protein|uniref:hypothetical protein n=1 Tax=Geitlerinema sp. PCC 9228 TaxID=111611 RepID=UPI0008F9DF9A|nr:hypothetical protein [Geitlerinema sp. PCC 9228]
MTAEIRTWLAEIENLQQQVAKLQQERDEALQSAHRWCQLYNKEAQRYRAQVQHSQNPPSQADGTDGTATSSSSDEVEATPIYGDIDALPASEAKHRLHQAYQQIQRLQSENRQLQQSLETEKQNHAQTRKNLTTALGDAVERLGKVQGRGNQPTASEAVPASHQQNSAVSGVDSAGGRAMVPVTTDRGNEQVGEDHQDAKNPSVELPPLQ